MTEPLAPLPEAKPPTSAAGPASAAQKLGNFIDENLLDRDVGELARRDPGRFWLMLAIIGGLVLVGLSAWRQGWFTPTSNLYVELPGAVGVQVGTAVKLKGFKIGEVDELNLEPNLNVKVRMRVVQVRLELLGQDASAKFGRDGPIGGKFIDILPGKRDGKRIAADATLPMDNGNELEDVMGTVKVAIEKLAAAIGKVEPILDDTKKLTGEATEMRKDIRQSVTTVLANAEAMSQQLKRVGDSAASVAGKMDGDRKALVSDIQKILSQANSAADSARIALKTLEQDLPQVTEKTKATLDSARDAAGNARDATGNVKQTTADVQQIVREARQDIPPTVRAARAATQDAAEITDGVKRSWPVRNMVSPPPDGNLSLDGFEGKAAGGGK
jgi:phospholipid/cholesterol/gamma-HCH transport system substrate-binding protein